MGVQCIPHRRDLSINGKLVNASLHHVGGISLTISLVVALVFQSCRKLSIRALGTQIEIRMLIGEEDAYSSTVDTGL